MAPEIALKEMQNLPRRSVVLDPVMGSGTVLRVALNRDLYAIGRDIDPLAVLMTRVWTTPLNTQHFCTHAMELVHEARKMPAGQVSLPWIDGDPETSAFIDFWFGEPQKADLRKLSALIQTRTGPEKDAMSIALSRIIITKDAGASLARDVSHSRPHRVMSNNVFSVIDGFLRSVTQLAKRLETIPSQSLTDVRQEDARNLASIASASVDAVLTSPPYLNALDYLRGHRLALVWLGYRLAELRPLRLTTIGVERGPDTQTSTQLADEILSQMALREALLSRDLSIIKRYVLDLAALLSEVSRVLRSGGKAVFVVGNSCIRGTFVRNALAIRLLAERKGLQYEDEEERELPPNRRYLPTGCTTR
jgi:DNA modification methylase